MINETSKFTLKGKTILITGASRGIGKAIALRAAREGANIAIVAKTAQAHPKLPGTIFSAASEVEAAGGKALAIQCDIRDDNQIDAAIQQTVNHFGGIDIVVNNASAISLTQATATSMKKFDLMHQVNTRGTFAVTRSAIPYLMQSANPHVLMISPPLSMRADWFAQHSAYTMSKMGMSMCVLGLSAELKAQGIAVNALWPKTIIATAALQAISGEGENMAAQGRLDTIVADAAYVMLCQPSRQYTGVFAIDEDLLRSQGITDFEKYLVTRGNKNLLPDFFIEAEYTFLLPPMQVLGGGSSLSSATSSASTNDLLAVPGFKASEFFQRINALVKSTPPTEQRARFGDLNAVFEFDIRNAENKVQTWTIDFKNAPFKLKLGKNSSKADICLSMTDSDFIDLAFGKLNGQKAFMMGKIKVKGNIMVAAKLDTLLQAARSTAKF